MYTPSTVIIHAGINDILNDKSHINTAKLLCNIKYMLVSVASLVLKTLISSLVYTTRVSLKMSGKIHDKGVLFVLVMV